MLVVKKILGKVKKYFNNIIKINIIIMFLVKVKIQHGRNLINIKIIKNPIPKKLKSQKWQDD